MLGGANEENNWKAIKLVENDEVVRKTLSEREITSVDTLVKAANKNADGDAEAKIADYRYQYIAGIVKNCVLFLNVFYNCEWITYQDAIITGNQDDTCLLYTSRCRFLLL